MWKKIISIIKKYVQFYRLKKYFNIYDTVNVLHLKVNEEKMKNSSLKKFNAQEHIIYKWRHTSVKCILYQVIK